jgi:putative protein-disulfide isomerase
MSTAVLHYIYDPLCGWCYAAAPLVRAARDVLPVVPHGGGMMSGARRQAVTPQLRDYVMPHDRRIAQLSGQPFGDAYFEGLLRDGTAVFDSLPPTAAMLAAEEAAGRGLDMLARLQTAHYVEGRRIADRAVLIELAAGLGLDEAAYTAALDEALGEPVQSHIAATRELMGRVGAMGFPTLLLQTAGETTTVDIGNWLGKPDAFVQWLRQQVPATGGGSDAGPAGFQCGPDGCAI